MTTPLPEFLAAIDPASLSYEDWVHVGMALKHEGMTAEDWDQWSQRDSRRYKQGECARKWNGFNGAPTPITAGTLCEIAKRHGWQPRRDEGRAYEWNETIATPYEADLRVVDSTWLEDAEVTEPGNWKPVDELILYLRTLFQSDEYVGYVMESWQNGDRWAPKRGSYSRTAGELIEELGRTKDMGAALGDYNAEAGAWIRFNPLDGEGIRDQNITAYRYALVESDTLSIERQSAIYEEMELPIAALVHSGKKSLHAIVRIDAGSKDEYRQRVNFLHEVCRKNGLEIDTQNKNPSRLSRMPGVLRDGHKQFLVSTSKGKASWDEWKDWIEEVNDNLPDFEPLVDLFDNLPPLAPSLIENILRSGHKCLLAGPSKAGKSYLLLELVIAIAEGRKWLGWQCSQGRVLYVNLELDRASCLHRLKNLYASLGYETQALHNIDLWNLRGKAQQMDALAPKLIRRAMKRKYAAIIIDPIYKVITGDENSADKMAHFHNQFDCLCSVLGASVIYCHHHSKGAQGGKASQDRSSGSGVFNRDPDALLDLIELVINEDRRKVINNRVVCKAIIDFLNEQKLPWEPLVGQDDMLVPTHFVNAIQGILNSEKQAWLRAVIRAAECQAGNVTGWRMEGTLREFAPLKPVNILFRYPLHTLDLEGLLEGAEPEDPNPYRRKGGPKRDIKDSNKQTRIDAIEAAFASVNWGKGATIGELAQHMAKTEQHVRKVVKEHPTLTSIKGMVTRVQEGETDV